MDRDELAGGAARAGEQELVSTGSFAGGDPNSARRRPRRVAVLLVCAGVLAGAFLWQQAGRGGDAATTRTATTPAARETIGRQPTTGTTAPGSVGQDLVIRSGRATGRLTVRLAQRVQTGTDGSVLGLMLHLELSSGAETITPDSFVAAGPDGSTAPATGVTVLAPGSHVVAADGGFRITAPAALDLQVILPVPPGDDLVYLLSDATGETLVCFPVSG